MADNAIDWTLRVRDPGFNDWEALTLWLSMDPAHAAAFDAAQSLDQSFDDLVPDALPDPIEAAPSRFSRWPIFATAIAAALVAALIMPALFMPSSKPYAVSTRKGERRSLTLADGSRIDLNGGTRIVLDQQQPRRVRLEHGEAQFIVKHDSDHPFAVDVGANRYEDAGTRFNVLRNGQLTELAVAEGKVIFRPADAAVSVEFGQGLRVIDGEMRVERYQLNPRDVSSWKANRLTYSAASMSRVADDLERNLGLTVRLTPGSAKLDFTGTLKLPADPDDFFESVPAVLGLKAVKQGDGWMLATRDETIR